MVTHDSCAAATTSGGSGIPGAGIVADAHPTSLTHNLGDVTDRVFSGAPDSIQEVTCSRTGLNLSTGFQNETSWELRPWELLSIVLRCRRETKVL